MAKAKAKAGSNKRALEAEKAEGLDRHGIRDYDPAG